MKHLLNNLSEEEKSTIREQHAGGMKIMTENFRKLVNSKLGDVRTIVESTNWHAQDLDSVLIPLGFKKSRDEKFKTTYWEMGQGDDRNYVNVSFDQSQFPKVTVSMNAVKDGKKLHGETKIAKDIDVRTIEAFAKKFMNIVFPSVIKEDISNTPSKVDGGLPLLEQKSVLNSANLLDNKSETYNKQIGVKVLPDCFRNAMDIHKAGIFPSEIDILVDKLDFPMDDRDVQHATQWSQGNGFPGMMGGQGNLGNLGKRVVNKDGLWYPAVEDLRVKYNLDESFEDLGTISKKKELVKFRNALLQAYQYWLDCMIPA